MLEVIASMGDLISLDAEEVQVVYNGVFEFLFFFGRVGVVESNNQLAVKRFVCEVIVEECRLGMTDVEITAVTPLANGGAKQE